MKEFKGKFGWPQLSMVIVFIAMSAIAVGAPVHQARPEWPIPFYQLILINEGFALMATLVYGIILHLTLTIIKHYRNEH